MRNPVNWNVYAQGSQPAMLHGERGYTGHEQLNQFGLINMNARLYDPLLGRFLAPDAQVSAPETSNGFNRYLYASNNPLMNVDINGEEGLPWWWFGGNNNPSGGYQPDYNSNPGSNSGNNFHNNYSGPGSGNQGGGYSGYDGGNYGGNDSGNTTGLGSILFSILHEAIYGSGSSDTNKSNPFAGLNFKPTEILSVTPARKPFTPLSKPVGTGVSNVYSGGGNRRGNSGNGLFNYYPKEVCLNDVTFLTPVFDFAQDALACVLQLVYSNPDISHSIAGGILFVAPFSIGKLGTTAEFSEVNETTRLQSIVKRSASEVDALGDAAFTPKQLRAIERNPNLRAMYRGNRIDVRARGYVGNDPIFSHLKSNYTRGADFVDPFTGRWWDMTTSAQWQRHVIRYGDGGTLLNTY